MKTLPTIAFVSDAIYPYNAGGKETRLFKISTRMAAAGYDVHIYCMKWWEGKADRVEYGVHLHGICRYIPLYDGSRRSIKQGVLFGVACLKLLWVKFDVVDVDHMPFFPIYAVGIVCFLKRKKMIGTWHEVWGMAYWQKYLGNFKGAIAGWIEQFSILFPDEIITASTLTADRLRFDLGFTRKISIVPNGIDIAAIAKAPVSKIQSDVIYAGRLLKHKNIHVLIESIAQIKKAFPKIKVIINGEGPEKQSLTELADKLNLSKNIIFLPFKKDIHELYSLMKASKVFVVPSEREGFCIVVLEANACGLPVITVDMPDNAAKDLINGKNGQVVPLNSSDIAKSIEKLLNSSKKLLLTNELKKYDWDVITQKILSLY